MTVAIFNARGAQAAAIAGRVEAAGHEVRRLSRGAGDGNVAVDPEDEASIALALDGAEAAVFTIPQDYRAGVREAYAERVVRAAGSARLRRLVVNTAGPIFEGFDDPLVHELRAIRAILTGGEVPTVVLQATSFLDNLSAPWAAPAIVNQGVLAYPAAPDVRISWISHRSLGDFAAAALTAPSVEGRVFDIGGPEPVSGTDLAAAIGRAAGRDIAYAELPLEAFAAGLDQAFGPPAGARIAAAYRYYRDEPRASERDPAAWAPLGVRPESEDEWAARHDWRALAGGGS